MTGTLVISAALFVIILIIVAKSAVIVPQQSAFVVERLGKYSSTLTAGFHILFPFIDTIKYRHDLKELAIDIMPQVCITKDNVQVEIDGVLYLKIMDAKLASYGVSNYKFAIIQLAQTTLRSEIGKLELDRTLAERSKVNGSVVLEIDKASEPWGIKVFRYEIKNITPPEDVLSAMEKQMRAEREKRALVLESEGHRDSAINNAEGEKQKVIKESEAQKQLQINIAEGEAQAIMTVANATAEGLKKVGTAIRTSGGDEAVKLRVAEQYVEQFGKLAKEANTLILPASVSDLAGMIGTAMSVLNKTHPAK